MNFLGIDPDSKNSAFALLGEDGKVIDAWTFSCKTSCEQAQVLAHFGAIGGIRPSMASEPYTVICEGQKIYPPKSGNFDPKSNPDSQIKLARASGIALAYACRSNMCKNMEVVLPADWKQQKKKGAHQMQIWKSLGTEPTLRASKSYACPDEFMGMKPTKLKHIGDAIGLAQYGLDLYLWNKRKEEMKNGYK